jgi:ATP-dependent protease ClpP protease subunit
MCKLYKIAGLLIPFTLAACNSKPSSSEPTLERSCPQVITTPIEIIASDFKPVKEGDITININGTLTYDDSGLQNASVTLINNSIFKKRPYIHINIASAGGETSQGFALRDAIRHYGEERVSILCTTSASSSASFLFTTEAKKYALPSCEITTHAAKAEIAGANELGDKERKRIEKYAEKAEQKVTQRMRGLYKTSLKLTDSCASFLTRKEDTDLTAYDALKLGFVDAVLEPNGKMSVRIAEPKLQ